MFYPNTEIGEKISGECKRLELLFDKTETIATT